MSTIDRFSEFVHPTKNKRVIFARFDDEQYNVAFIDDDVLAGGTVMNTQRVRIAQNELFDAGFSIEIPVGEFV